MKIGLIIYGSLDTPSGGYLYDRLLVEYLRNQGDRVEVISLPWRNYVRHLLDSFSFRLPAGYDILIQDELNHPSLIMANKAEHPCPVIALVHHLRCSEFRPKWQNAVYRRFESEYLLGVDGFIFNSLTTKAAVEQLVQDEKPRIVAPPPTNRLGAPMTEDQIRARSSRDPFRILFLGNVIARKGLHTLLEAVRDLNKKIQIDVIGSLKFDPKYARAMQNYAALISAPVIFHSSLDRETLIEELGQAHILVVPSTYEGFGIVYLEGMGFGLPAIGTAAGAANEIIKHGINGYLIEPGDHRALAKHISILAEDRIRLTELSLHARARFVEQPAWEHSAQSIREFLLRQVNP